jgi:hypothetical protein
MRAFLFLLALMALAQARAAESIEVCYNYGCAGRADVSLDTERLEPVRGLLAAAMNAEQEREAIAQSIGALLLLAGEQSPIAADRGGNLADDGVNGRMDCIDHSTTTTRLLGLLESHGWLRFHRTIDPVRRTSFVLFQHFSAVIEELVPRSDPMTPAPVSPSIVPTSVPDYVPLMLALCDCESVLSDLQTAAVEERLSAVVQATQQTVEGARFVVDSWFVDHGEPAVVLPLARWLNGEGPNVQ